MTHPELDRDFPIRPFSTDPYLRSTLNQWEYCDGRDDLVHVRESLDHELSSPQMIERLYRALDDQDECLRVGAAARIIRARLPNAEQVALRFLNDPEIYARMTIAELCDRFNSPTILEKIIELIRSDPASEVRGSACCGLLGKEPVRAIPLLLSVIDSDHEFHDMTPPPSQVAATVLDLFLGTHYMATYLDDGFATFRPGGQDLDGLKEHARRVLNQLSGK